MTAFVRTDCASVITRAALLFQSLFDVVFLLSMGSGFSGAALAMTLCLVVVCQCDAGAVFRLQ